MTTKEELEYEYDKACAAIEALASVLKLHRCPNRQMTVGHCYDSDQCCCTSGEALKLI